MSINIFILFPLPRLFIFHNYNIRIYGQVGGGGFCRSLREAAWSRQARPFEFVHRFDISEWLRTSWSCMTGVCEVRATFELRVPVVPPLPLRSQDGQTEQDQGVDFHSIRPIFSRKASRSLRPTLLRGLTWQSILVRRNSPASDEQRADQLHRDTRQLSARAPENGGSSSRP